MAFLTPDKVRTEHGLVIKEKIIPFRTRWKMNAFDGNGKLIAAKGDLYKADRLLSGGTGKVQWITIHNTDDINEAKGTNDAEQYARAVVQNQSMGLSREHYYIDETDCWQVLAENEVGWHAADGNGPGNETSIAVEIIMNGSGSKDDVGAEDRGALLAAILLDRHNLGIDKLTTHKHWYPKKECPYYILPHWDAFKAKVERYLKQIKSENDNKDTDTPAAGGKTLYRVQVGAFSKVENAMECAKSLKAKGFDNFIVYVDKLYKVQVGAFSFKSNAEAMKKNVVGAGFEAFVTTTSTKPLKSNEEIAKEVARGDWGNGDERRKRLETAGYDHDAVQKIVNNLI